MTYKLTERPKLTSPKQRPLRPIDHQQNARAEADALGKVHAAPQIHSQQAAAEAEPIKVKHSGVANVRQAAQMLVLKRLVDGVVQIAIVDLVEPHSRRRLRNLVELAPQVLALLVGALGRGGK